jgi:hypothetical protein
MSVANLTRYTIDYVPDSCDGDYVQHNVSKDGEYVKFEEAMEASSNSLRQLKTEIAALVPKLYQAYYDSDVTPEQFEPVINKLQQLSAV